MKKNKKYETKKYIHFDIRKKYDKCKRKVENRDYVSKHAFYPFIKKKLKSKKYVKNEIGKKIRKDKCREIYITAHMDNYIYKFYGEELNEKYNVLAKQYKIDDEIIAYRNNKKGEGNIEFAKEAFDFLRAQKKCYIYLMDFSKFFDKLDHKHLKKSLNTLFNDTIPKEHYAIYKNITKFSWIESEDVEKSVDRNEIKKKSRLYTPEDFRNMKFKNLKKNKKTYGIPQGTAISSIYSNIYMSSFDKEITDYARENNGFYRRYCDDIILIIPIKTEEKNIIDKIDEKIDSILEKTPNLAINNDKTERCILENEKITNVKKKKDYIEYLGFSFNGKQSRIRNKSISKYYLNLRKNIEFIRIREIKLKRNSNKSSKKCRRKELYAKKSHLGVNEVKYSFIKYVYKANKKFEDYGEDVIKKQVKNHMKFIKRELENNKLNSKNNR